MWEGWVHSRMRLLIKASLRQQAFRGWKAPCGEHRTPADCREILQAKSHALLRAASMRWPALCLRWMSTLLHACWCAANTISSLSPAGLAERGHDGGRATMAKGIPPSRPAAAAARRHRGAEAGAAALPVLYGPQQEEGEWPAACAMLALLRLCSMLGDVHYGAARLLGGATTAIAMERANRTRHAELNLSPPKQLSILLLAAACAPCC